MLLVIDQIASRTGENTGTSIVERIARENPNLFSTLLEWIDQEMSSAERQFAEALLVSGLFDEFSSERRVAAIALARTIDRRIGDQELRKRLASYHGAQSIFRELPELLNELRRSGQRPPDLISARRLEKLSPMSRSVCFRGRFAEIDSFLPLPTLDLLLRSAPDLARLYLRLHPERVSTEKPPEQVNEEVIRPIDPGWWRHGRVYRNSPTGLFLALQPPVSPSDDLARYWDYHSRGIRKLEMSVIRRGGNYLTVMVEELQQIDQAVFGRCLHTDVQMRVGVPLKDLNAEHLDVSINWYPGELGAKRLAARLDQGQKVDAELHTHLARVDGSGFVLLFPCGASFFQSPVLCREWLDAQGGGG